MHIKKIILIALCIGLFSGVEGQHADAKSGLVLDFFGDSVTVALEENITIPVQASISHETIKDFYQRLSHTKYQPIITALQQYRLSHPVDDWFFYQMIRYTAEQISPKAVDYNRYTLYKWFFLLETGYRTLIRHRNDTLLLYVQSEESIYDIPYIMQDNKQYICLNYHDYDSIDFTKGAFVSTPIDGYTNAHSFSYKITSVPDFKVTNYSAKELGFAYGSKEYHFSVLVNKQIQKIFTNYPVVDYAYQFSIPLSKTTYESLIPVLKKELSGLTQQSGVNYLMHFTRNAFAFETDSRIYGKEKRLSPEQMLLYDYSDCEDRSAFFFFLVKEIYNLPMIVLSYPTHITVAVQFDQASGNPLLYKGNRYWVCEPTPQKKDLKIGQVVPSLRKQAYEVVYEYAPQK